MFTGYSNVFSEELLIAGFSHSAMTYISLKSLASHSIIYSILWYFLPFLKYFLISYVITESFNCFFLNCRSCNRNGFGYTASQFRANVNYLSSLLYSCSDTIYICIEVFIIVRWSRLYWCVGEFTPARIHTFNYMYEAC